MNSQSTHEQPATIELGVIIAGPLDPVDREAVDAVVAETASLLISRLPDFDWQLSKVRCDEWTSFARVEPTELLQQARDERDEQGWDFAFVITASDLVSHYKPYSLAVISRSLDVAVVSTARIDPRAVAPATPDDERSEQIKPRVLRLMLNAFGHWLGLSHVRAAGNAMNDIDSITDLGTGIELTVEQCTSPCCLC